MSESHIRHSTYHIPEDMLWRKAAKRVRIGSYFLLPFPVEELLFKKSVLTPLGARHTTLWKLPLQEP